MSKPNWMVHADACHETGDGCRTEKTQPTLVHLVPRDENGKILPAFAKRLRELNDARAPMPAAPEHLKVIGKHKRARPRTRIVWSPEAKAFHKRFLQAVAEIQKYPARTSKQRRKRAKAIASEREMLYRIMAHLGYRQSEVDSLPDRLPRKKREIIRRPVPQWTVG